MNILRDLFGPGTWGTGGNLVAWVICGMLAIGGGFLFRKRLIPWVQKHWNAHASNGWADEMAALKSHISGELAEHRKDIAAAHDLIHRRLDDHADLIRTAAQTAPPPPPPARRTPAKGM